MNTCPSNQSDPELAGFVCPDCLLSLRSSDELLIHFQENHNAKNFTSSTQSTLMIQCPPDSEARQVLFNEVYKHNHVLIERVKDDGKLISELQTLLNLVLNGTPLPENFTFRDNDLKQGIDSFLEAQVKYASIESELEDARGHLVQLQEQLSTLQESTGENSSKAVSMTCHPLIDMSCQTDGDPGPEPTEKVEKETFRETSIQFSNSSCQTEDMTTGPTQEINFEETEILEQKLKNLQDALNAATHEKEVHIEEQQKLKILVASQSTELKSQIEQLTNLKSQLDRFKSQNHTLNEELVSQYQRVQELETSLGDCVSAHQSQLSERDSEVHELRNTLDKLRLELNHANTRCEELTEQSKQLTERVKQSELELGASKSELDDWKSQLNSARKEADSLLDRLMNSEDKYTTLEEQYLLQHKQLGDLNKALFELGHENQSLQMLREKVMNRQWTKDTDAPCCIGCNREFSLSNRRHHCRNCGGVFCQSCSSNRAPTPASKDPVRVCNPCYLELCS